MDMTQHVQSATRAQNLLRLLVTDPSLSVTGVRVDDAGLVSDHRLVAANISVHRRAVRAVPKSFRPIRKIDTDEFEQSLWNSELFSSPASTVDGFAKQLERVVIAELDRVAPLKHCRRRPSKPITRWLSQDAINAKRERRRLERHGGVHSSTLIASRTVKCVVVPTNSSMDPDTTSTVIN